MKQRRITINVADNDHLTSDERSGLTLAGGTAKAVRVD
jgi:hypothetical protein